MLDCPLLSGFFHVTSADHSADCPADHVIALYVGLFSCDALDPSLDPEIYMISPDFHDCPLCRAFFM